MASSIHNSSGFVFVTMILVAVLLPQISSGDVCNGVECGKGTCKPSTNSTSPFVCDCDSGWKQGFTFLPCVIPNCSIDYACSEASPPVQPKDNQTIESIFDPCYWADCGGGSCNRTSIFTHSCDCRDGYYNLLNISAFPCYRDCALGLDCSSLGIPLSNKSTSSPPPISSKNTSNQAAVAASWRWTNSMAWLICIYMIVGSVILGWEWDY